jgi:hypothetical protein
MGIKSLSDDEWRSAADVKRNCVQLPAVDVRRQSR